MPTVTNTLFDQAGDPALGAVEIGLVTGDPEGGWDATAHRTYIARWRYPILAADLGVWSVALQPNSSLSPSGTYYEVTERVEGTGSAKPLTTTYAISVPASASTLYARNLLITPSSPVTDDELTLHQGSGDPHPQYELATVTVAPAANGTDDTAALQAVIDGLPTTSNDPYGGTIQLRAGIYIIGAAGLSVPNGVMLRGAGETSTILRAKAATTVPAIVHNADTDGTQEFIWVERLQIQGNKGNSAVVGAGLLLDTVYVNSSVRDVVILDCSGHGLHIKATGTPASGPILVENTWVTTSNDHNIYVEGQVASLSMRSVTSENQAAGKHGLYIKQSGSTASGGHHLSGLHFEFSGANSSGLVLEGTPAIHVDGVRWDGAVAAGQSLVKILGDNVEDQFGSTNIVLLSAQSGGMTGSCIDDQARSVTVAGPVVTSYMTNTSRFVGPVFLGNASAPSTPTAGGMLYVASGALTYVGPGGTTTTIAPT